MGLGVFSEISFGVVLGEVCWYINMYEVHLLLGMSPY